MKKPLNTSWGGVADWYSDLLKEGGTYQKEVILPNLSRLMQIKKGTSLLDLGCGTGFFSRAFSAAGAKVTGVDLGAALIASAKRDLASKAIDYHIASADKIPFVPNASIDQAVIVLALQNMANAAGAIAECARVLKPSGRLYLVLNHPAFRIPQGSSWGWDEGAQVQYRRLDRYLSEAKMQIQMHPGADPSEVTWSFHRSLQFYFKLLGKQNLAVSRLEEWVTHTRTREGSRKDAENKARAEFPVFLYLEIVKIAR